MGKRAVNKTRKAHTGGSSVFLMVYFSLKFLKSTKINNK